MEITSSILQGLSDVITGTQTRSGQTEPEQVQGYSPIIQNQSKEPVRGFEEAINFAEAARTGDSLRILSVGEREILSLLFGEQREVGGGLYQSQTSQPAALGNFVDIRG